MIGIVLLALMLINAITFFVFGHDKARARQGGRRIAETDLLGLALIGGSPGALVARQVFRHKARKQPFSTYLLLIVAIQLGLLIGFFLI